jgi:hypothetical protein
MISSGSQQVRIYVTNGRRGSASCLVSDFTKTMRDIEDGDLDSAHRERYRDLSGNKPTVMSYDRLMEWMQHETDSHGQTQNCAPE